MTAAHVSDEIILTPEQKAKFEEDYQITAEMQKTCGQIIYGIVAKKGLKSARKTQYEIDVKKVMELTGLNQNTIYLLNNPERCKLTKAQIVSFSIGLDLDVHATAYLLAANGMVFNTNNRVDKAYVHLIEKYRDRGIDDCNAILRDLGIEEKHFLGAHERNL